MVGRDLSSGSTVTSGATAPRLVLSVVFVFSHVGGRGCDSVFFFGLYPKVSRARLSARVPLACLQGVQ